MTYVTDVPYRMAVSVFSRYLAYTRSLRSRLHTVRFAMKSSTNLRKNGCFSCRREREKVVILKGTGNINFHTPVFPIDLGFLLTWKTFLEAPKYLSRCNMTDSSQRHIRERSRTENISRGMDLWTTDIHLTHPDPLLTRVETNIRNRGKNKKNYFSRLNLVSANGISYQIMISKRVA